MKIANWYRQDDSVNTFYQAARIKKWPEGAILGIFTTLTIWACQMMISEGEKVGVPILPSMTKVRVALSSSSLASS
jgi:hypothetical protein